MKANLPYAALACVVIAACIVSSRLPGAEVAPGPGGSSLYGRFEGKKVAVYIKNPDKISLPPNMTGPPMEINSAYNTNAIPGTLLDATPAGVDVELFDHRRAAIPNESIVYILSGETPPHP